MISTDSGPARIDQFAKNWRAAIPSTIGPNAVKNVSAAVFIVERSMDFQQQPFEPGFCNRLSKALANCRSRKRIIIRDCWSDRQPSFLVAKFRARPDTQ